MDDVPTGGESCVAIDMKYPIQEDGLSDNDVPFHDATNVIDNSVHAEPTD